MSDRSKTVGFIGMGMMGGGMAANLLKAGFPLVAYDIDPVKNERFAGLGATIANGPAGVSQGASTVVCIVETTKQVEEVVLGDGGILEGAQEGDIFVCSATVDPIMVKELCGTLAARGIAGFSSMLKHYEEHAPLKRNVLPAELGAAGTFLASDGAAAITGQVIYVDGGYQVMGM